MLNKFETQLAYLKVQVPSPLVLHSLYNLRDTLTFITETDLRVSSCNVDFHRACARLVNLELAVHRAIRKVQGALRKGREGGAVNVSQAKGVASFQGVAWVGGVACGSGQGQGHVGAVGASQARNVDVAQGRDPYTEAAQGLFNARGADRHQGAVEGLGQPYGEAQDALRGAGEARPAIPGPIDEGVRNLRQAFSGVLEPCKGLASMILPQANDALRVDSAARGASEGQPTGMATGGAQNVKDGMPEGLEQGAAPWPFGSKSEADSSSQLKYVWIVHTSTATYICADQLEAVRTFNACEYPGKFMSRVREDYVEAIRKVRQGFVSGNIRIELSDEPFHKSPYSFLNFK